MEKTGLTGKVYGFIEKLDKNDIIKANSKIISDENKLFIEMTNDLRSMSKSKDIVGILNFERAVLKYELSKCSDIPQDQGKITSLGTAVRDLDKAREVFDNVFNPEKYKEIVSSYSEQKIDRTKDGLPRDAFHRFIDSHITRLGNRLIHDDGSFEKRNFIKTRRESVSFAKQEYMNLQSKALNIPIPEKSKDREI